MTTKGIAAALAALTITLTGCSSDKPASVNRASEQAQVADEQPAGEGSAAARPANPVPIIKKIPGCRDSDPDVQIRPGMGIEDQRWADCYGEGDVQARVRTYSRPITPADVGTVEDGEVVVVNGKTNVIATSSGKPTAAEIIAVVGGQQQAVTP